jgi:predicted permease
VLSHAFWESRFGADPEVVGTEIQLNGVSFTVVGVAPKGFTGLFIVGFSPAAWVPLMMADQVTPGSGREMLQLRNRRWLRVVGRLSDGAGVEKTQAALANLARGLELEYPDTNKGVGIQVYPEREARPAPGTATMLTLAMTVLMAIVGMVLLVACANVANLLLARATARNREIALRQALGAGRWRLVRQMLTESVVLATFGGLGGLVLAVWGSRLLAAVELPTDIPFYFDLGADLRLLSFAVVVTFATGVVFGLIPALKLSRPDLVPSLKGEGIGSTSGGSRSRLRSGLVVTQVAVSMVVLIGAGLFLRSLQKASEIDPGFNPDHLLLMSVDPTLNGYDRTRSEQFYRLLRERSESIAEVEVASFATPLPLDFFAESVGIAIEGREARPGEDDELVSLYSLVGPSYFETMETAVLRGRGFTEQDDSNGSPVAIINESFAELYWPGEDPLHKRIHLEGPMAERDPGRATVEVIGVVADGKYRSLDENPVGYLFLPLYQRPATSAVTLLTRTTANPLGPARALRAEIRSIDENLPVFDIETMNEHVESSFMATQMAANLVGLFGVIGLALAGVGLYGVVSYSVSHRTREIGLRMALGATRSGTLGMVVKQAAVVTLIGVIFGLGAGIALARVAASLLYGVSAADPVVFTAVTALLLAVGLMASAVPAWRATRIDPITALRYE